MGSSNELETAAVLMLPEGMAQQSLPFWDRRSDFSNVRVRSQHTLFATPTKSQVTHRSDHSASNGAQTPNHRRLLLATTMTGVTHQRTGLGPHQARPAQLEPPPYSTREMTSRVNSVYGSQSTPDLHLSPSTLRVSQSNSVPSLTSTTTTSGLTTTSYASISISNSGFPSFSSSRDLEYFNGRGEGDPEKAWPSNDSAAFPPSPFTRAPQRRRRRPKNHGRTMVGYLREAFNQPTFSLWDRLVFLAFCVHAAILFRAIFGIGNVRVAGQHVRANCTPPGLFFDSTTALVDRGPRAATHPDAGVLGDKQFNPIITLPSTELGHLDGIRIVEPHSLADDVAANTPSTNQTPGQGIFTLASEPDLKESEGRTVAMN